MNLEEPSQGAAPSAAPASPQPPLAPPGPRAPGRALVPVVIGGAVLAILVGGGLLVSHAESKNNKVALSSSPKPVTVIAAVAKEFRPSRAYVGTMEAWLAASVGPQLVSAYVDTVLVRPGAVVKRGEVLATLDCRDASAASQGVAMEARAIDARQKAFASESARLHTLLAGNFVSANEVEQKAAQSLAEEAQLQAMKAKLTRSTLEVGDCILRAPFDGEVATRTIDPGAFVRPGVSIVSVVDRSTVRLSADVPESDFDVVAPGRTARIDVAATRREIVGVIARRAPAADPGTRTVHFEIDLLDPEREIPVGTTGEAHLDVGEPVAATEIPIYAASVRGKKATVFIVEGDVARLRTVNVLGEIGGSLFVEQALPPGALVVTEGRALLNDGDHVSLTRATDPPPAVVKAAAPMTTAAPAVTPAVASGRPKAVRP